MAEIVRAIGNYGSKQKYVNEYQGLNSRLDEIQAAFLSIKLKYLDIENQRRREIAKFYCESILNPKIVLPIGGSEYDPIIYNKEHVWHLFVIRTKNRDKLQKHLAENDIQSIIHYPIPPHKQAAFNSLNSTSLPITETIHNEVLSLPISPVLSIVDAENIVKTINNF